MAWWKFGRNRSISPDILARELFNVFVAEGMQDDLESPLFEAITDLPRLSAKLVTLRKGAALYALASLAQSDTKAGLILRAYEALIFGSNPGAHEDVGQAMLALESLRREPDLPLTWAQEWLADVGVRETNAITLSQICFHWMEALTQAGDAVAAIAKL